MTTSSRLWRRETVDIVPTTHPTVQFADESTVWSKSVHVKNNNKNHERSTLMTVWAGNHQRPVCPFHPWCKHTFCALTPSCFLNQWHYICSMIYSASLVIHPTSRRKITQICVLYETFHCGLHSDDKHNKAWWDKYAWTNWVFTSPGNSLVPMLTWAFCLSFARSKPRLCPANHGQATSVTWPVIG